MKILSVSNNKVKKTGLLLLIFAIFLGLIAAFLNFTIIKSSAKTVDVLVAKDTIEEGDPLSKDMFEVKQIHPSGRPDTAISVDELDLNGTVAAKGMLKGDILRKEHLVKIADVDQELPLISSRLKAIGDDKLVGAEIPVDSVEGILDGIKKGDRISVVSVRKGANDQIQSEVILKNIEVLVVKSTDDGDKVLAVALTLPEFAKLSEAKDTGTIHISVQPLGVLANNTSSNTNTTNTVDTSN